MEEGTTQRGDRDLWFELVSARAERIADQMLEAMRAEIPAFREVPGELVREDALAHFRRGLTTLYERRRPTLEEIEATRAMGARRARLGLPLEAVLQATRVAVLRGWELCLAPAEEAGIPSSALLEEMRAAWEWADETTGYAAEGHRSVKPDNERRREQRRTAFVRQLLTGSLSSAEVGRDAAEYGLDPDESHVAFRVRPSPQLGLPELRRVVEARGEVGGHAPLVAALDGEVAGVFAATPAFGVEVALGVGPPAPLHAMQTSFAVAGRVLDAAVGFGLSGVTTLEDLGVRLAVASEEGLGEALVRRYLAPLDALGDFGATLQTTLAEYLRRSMRVEETARSLHVHPNSVRHRLARFEELTGVDVRGVDDVVGLWWALERRALERRRGATGREGPPPAQATDQ